ncbi:hypothetical protein D3C83_144560 [compost metagenome]
MIRNAAVPYAAADEMPYSRPPIIGPAMFAVCHADELTATALPRASGATRFGASEELAGPAKARAIPSMTSAV